MANIKRANTSGITKSGVAIPDVPDAPTIGAATDVGTSRAFNNGSATVAFTAAATGGTSTSFTATSTPGSFTASGAGSPLTVTGLQSATSYTFAVTGTNASATGPAGTSASITATTVPQAPTIGTATAGDLSASVSFTAGATGGKAVSTYTATSSPGSITGTASSSPITVSGLTAGTAYTFTVTATNANGTSTASSASNSVTPTVPALISVFGSTGVEDRAQSVVVDSSGNAVVAGFTTSSGNNRAYLASIDATGNFGYQRSLYSSGYNWNYRGLAIDSGGNYIAVGTAVDPGGSDKPRGLIAKYNSSGTIQWRNFYGTDNNYNIEFQRVERDSSDNYYVLGQMSGSGNPRAMIVKYNSSGTKQWETGVWSTSPTNGAVYSTGIAVDSSGNVFVSFNWYSNYFGGMAKFNSSGTLQWMRELRASDSNQTLVTDIKIDSGGNVIFAAAGGPSGASGYFIGKVNTSGTLQFLNRYGFDGYGSTSLRLDGSNNIYAGITGFNDSGITLVKFNSSGTVQWQNRLTTLTYNTLGQIFLSSDTIYASGSTNKFDSDTGGPNPYFWRNGYLLKVPIDGSKTKSFTYNGTSMTYATSDATSHGASAMTLPSLSLQGSGLGLSANTSFSGSTDTPSVTMTSTTF